MSQNALPDDDRTVNTAAGLQPEAAPASAAVKAGSGNALPPGTCISEFEIIRVLGIGGFGIVYLATDTSLGRKVALKEYMPVDHGVRVDGLTVSALSSRHAETFNLGLRSFINEAHLLAQFNHPSLVKVLRFWEANGTAYMVMPFYEGKTLKETLVELQTPPSESWLRDFLSHILDALRVMHAEQCFHRDIAPDNILMTRDCPVLLDFGAARRLLEHKDQAVTAIFKPGYAPIEQYGQSDGMTQGAWTDLYALASVVHLAIMGKLPLRAMERMLSDSLEPLERAAQVAMPGRYSAGFLHAIDRALALKPKDRPQSIAEFYSLLDQKGAAPRRSSPSPNSLQPGNKSRIKPSVMAAGGMGLMAVLLMGWMVLGGKARPPSGTDAVTGTAAPAQTAPVATPVPSPKPEFNPVRLLEDIVRGKTSGHEVTVVVEKGQVVIGKDMLRFKLRSSRPGHVYVLMLDANHSHLSMLFPNGNEKNNRIEAGNELQLPPAGWNFQAQGPPGTDQFVALVSDSPRDFSAAGLNAEGEFLLSAARKSYDAFKGTTAFFAGTAVCAGGVACPDSYGAAAFSIEEIQRK